MRTAGWAGLLALLAGDWQVTGGVLKIARRIWEVGVAGSPVIDRRRGTFSTLLRRPGLRASTGGVLATKRERKMLASRLHACTRSVPSYVTASSDDVRCLSLRRVASP